jgi:hypothetical protein
MRVSKLETAKKLARAHYAIEPNLKQIFLLEPIKEHDRTEPIKLLEVVEGTIERGIEPIAFAPDPIRGIEYPSFIIEISPNEYRGLRHKKDGLTRRGWRVGTKLSRS